MQSPLFSAAGPLAASRAEGLRRLAAFVPRAGRTYAAERNYDRGPERRTNVSQLSPYIRQRAVSEVEVLAAVLARHSLAGAEKFVQEVFWRTYWKGWLESHPAAWTRYLATLAQRHAELAESPELRTAHANATAGATGIDAFDAWATELVTGNYLHNHARMWFASIWIFTLGLPWELGADFFMRNLLDGDPASNTLSWRWVAGLHTRGKTYTATRDNIRRYTEDRYSVEPLLARSTVALDDAPLAQERLPAVPGPPPAGAGPALLLLHEDDLIGDPAQRALVPAGEVRGVGALRAVDRRSPQGVNPAVAAFSDALAAEAVTSWAVQTSAIDLGVLAPSNQGEHWAGIVAAAAQCGATRILVPFAPVGPVRTLLDGLRPAAHAAGLEYTEFGRRYDAAAWPAATRGFFGLRARIPTVLAELGVGAG